MIARSVVQISIFDLTAGHSRPGIVSMWQSGKGEKKRHMMPWPMQALSAVRQLQTDVTLLHPCKVRKRCASIYYSEASQWAASLLENAIWLAQYFM